MKLYRNIIILIVVLGLLAGAYFAAEDFKRFQREGNDEDTETIEIFSFDSDEVTRVIVETNSGVFEFEKKDDDWKAVRPADLVRLNTGMVDSIAHTMSRLNAEKIIEENAQDLSVYGLDKPIRITVILEGNTSKVLEVGNQNLTRDAYYVRPGDSDTVYTISNYEGNTFIVNKNDFKLRNLYDFGQEEITRLAMEKNGKLLFSARKIGEDRFELTEPVIVEADMEAIQQMLKSVEQSFIIDFIEEHATDLKKYGLDKPSYAISVETDKVKKKLLIGDERVKNQEFYAKFADDDEVFTVGTGTYSFLDKHISEISERFIYATDIKNVEALKIEFDGKVYDTKIQTNPEDSSKDRFWVNGVEVTDLRNETGSQLYRKLYQAVIGVLLNDINPNEKPPANAKAEVRFTYKLKIDPGQVVIEFVPRDEYTYYVMRDGKYTGLIVDEKRFDEYDGLRTAIENLTEAMEKKGK